MYSFGWQMDHRLLRAFPTRRSSDLSPVEIQTPRQYGHVTRYPMLLRRAPPRGSSCTSAAPSAAWRRVKGARSGAVTKSLDRKSTRLNSSHSQTSYAVFWLKKLTEKK